MARHKFTSVSYSAALKKVGAHGDGGGLWLRVLAGPDGKPSRASWVLIFQVAGRRREMGLGPAGDGKGKTLSLVAARAAAADAHALIKSGVDPIEDRKKRVSAEAHAIFAAAGGLSVEAALREVHAANKHKWKSASHRECWDRTYSYIGKLGSARVDEVEPDEVAKALSPLWKQHIVTADRVRGRLEMAFDLAIAKGIRKTANPATKRIVNVLLGKPNHKIVKRRAMDYQDAPAFIAKLREHQDRFLSARALEFGILTGTRANEFCGARWDEVDLDKGLWTISGKRMKNGREHVVPLTERCMQILRRQANERSISQYVFPNARQFGHVGQSTVIDLLDRMGERKNTTIHGWRSTMRDYLGDETDVAREVAEGVLAHHTGGVEGAYRRKTALAKRRVAMELWAEYLDGGSTAAGGNVVKMPKAKKASKG